MRKSTVFSSGFFGRQIFKMLGIGLAGLLTYSVSNAQLSAGTYYINGQQPTGGNSYQSFAAFFTALSNAGNSIASPGITLRVLPQTGGYNELITIPNISGLGPIQGGESRLRIVGDGTANTRIYGSPSSTNGYAVVYLNQADYISFDSLTVQSTGSYFAMKLYLSADHINVTNCHLLAGTGFSDYCIAATDGSTFMSGNANNPEDIFLENNIFEGGRYGAYLYGNTTTSHQENVIIRGCTFKNQTYGGLWCYYYTNVELSGCTFENTNTSSFRYDTRFWYCNDLMISKNFFNDGAYYPIYMYRPNNSATSQITGDCIISNNSIHGNNSYGSGYGIYAYDPEDLKVVYNSIFMGGTNFQNCYGALAINNASNTTEIKNNVIRVEGTNNNDAIYGYSNTGWSSTNFDYNTFYTENSSGVNYDWNFSTINGLSSFQSTSGTSANSQEADPSFVSATDLHVNGANLYAQGTPLTYVTDDIDGTARSATAPSHGIHEFIPPQNDAGVVTFASPVAVCADTGIVVSVTIRNFGIQTLTSFDLDWSWTGNTGGGSGSVSVSNAVLPTGADTTIQVTSISMTAGSPGYTFQAYTSNPNSVTDENFDNDTTNYSTQTAMEGGYTIGGTSPDFVTFGDAVVAMGDYGVCDHVTFYARPGTYNERVVLDGISGVGMNSTVTFTSDTATTGTVKLEYSSSNTSDAGVIKIDNQSYITVDGYDIENTGSSYAQAISITGDASNITIQNCNGWNASTSFTSDVLEVYTQGFDGEDIHILNNTFSGGYYGVYVYGYDGSGPGLDGFKFNGNTVEDASRYGTYMFYFKNAEIIGNHVDVTGPNSSSFSYGMMLYGYGTGYNVSENQVRAYYYGLFLSQMSGTSQNYGIVANNKAHIGDTAAGITNGFYALYFSGSGFLNVAHNLAISQTTSGYAAYFNGGLMEVYNNIFARVNGGSIINVQGSFSVTAADNNAYLALNGASSGLSYMQGLGYDANGVELDSATYANLDSLFTCSDSLVGRGMPLSMVPTDIDGAGRSQTAPTIGPHEYVSAGDFDLGDDMKICAGDTVTLGSNLAGASFSWNTGDTTGTIDVTSAGQYSVTITSGCGTANGSINIEDGSSVANWTSVASWLTHSFTNSSTNGTSYLWDFGDGNTSTAMNPVHLYADTGMYEVCLTTTGDCDADTKCEMVRAWNGVGIGEFDASKAISMYPNPATDVLVIEASDVPGNVMTVEVSSISGQIVMSDRLNDFNGYAKEQMDISSLTQGVYFVKIFTNEVSTTKRLVVKK